MSIKVIDRRTLNAALEEERLEEEAQQEAEAEDPKKRMMREDGIAEDLTPLEERRIIVPHVARKNNYELGYSHGIERRPPQNQDPDYLEGWMEGHERAGRVGSGAPIIVPPKL